jgi:hypothetical protein
VRIGDTADIRTLLEAMDGEHRGPLELRPDQAKALAWYLRRAADRLWWSGWARLARMIANDADRLANRGETWVID